MKPARLHVQRRYRRSWHWVRSWLPRTPTIAIVLLSGALNIASGVQHPPLPLEEVATPQLTELNGSLSVLGHGTQALLGAALILLAVGLAFRLRAAWVFSLLLSVITVGVNLLQRQFGASLVLPGLLLVALLVTGRQFDRRTVFANYLISALSIAAVLAYGIVGADLLGAGFKPPIHGAFTALYFTIVTLSTVGYGDIVPVTDQTRLFAMSLIIVGIGIFATAIASSLAPTIAGQLGRLFRTDRTRMPLNDHVILVGSGTIAENTARELERRSLDYVQVIGAEPAGGSNPRAIVGDPSNDDVLRAAGIAGARLLVAAEEDDSENAFVSLLAKDLNPAVQVLAVASNERSIRRLKLARADVVFAPSVIGGRLVADLVEGGTVPDEFTDLLQRGDSTTSP